MRSTLDSVFLRVSSATLGDLGYVFGGERKALSYTWTLVGFTVALGVRGAVRSEAAIRAAMTNATVVKKPNTFCILVRELYIVTDRIPKIGGRGGEEDWGQLVGI